MASTDEIPKAASLRDFIQVQSTSPDKPVRTSWFLLTDDDRVFFGEAVGKGLREVSLDHCNANLKPIADERLFPLVPSGVKLKIAPNNAPDPVFIKRPGMADYTDSNDDNVLPYDTPSDVLNETLTMEKISSAGGHDNIVSYHGCRVHRGRITAIVLEEHEQTLLQCRDLDPAAFARLDREAVMAGLEAAVGFIHDLGLAHNDISPYNVMIGKQGEPILIDFGSCKTCGERLQTCGTDGFSREGFHISQKINDEFSIGKMREWMEKEQSAVSQALSTSNS